MKFSELRSRLIRIFPPQRDKYLFLLLFALLVASGITGSSMGWMKSYPGMSGIVQLNGERKFLGIYRGIRGDEFIAHAIPYALMQYQTNRKFPLYNHQLGLSGRNMLMLHDTGAPVWHPAILARPATWGFFFLDLRRSLAWYWWTPIFIGIAGIWFLLNQLYPEHSRRNLLFAVAGAVCPYTAAWSFWPLYDTAGVLIGCGAMLKAASAPKRSAAIFYGALSGWAFAFAALTIYMPWVWSALTLAIFLFLAEMMQRRGELPWRQSKFYWAFGAMLIVFLSLLGSFIISAASEIQLVAQAVYPGRRINCGGAMGLWESVKGFYAPITIYKVGYGNQCEMQSAQLYLFPLLCFLLLFRKKLHWNARLLAPLLFMLWAFLYQYAGLPRCLAQLTLWNHCTPGRVEMALHLAQLFLLAALWDDIAQKEEDFSLSRNKALLWGLLTVLPAIALFFLLPEEVFRGFSAALSPRTVGLLLLFILCVVSLLNTLLFCSFRKFLLGAMLFSLLPAAVFNPVTLAASSISSPLAEKIDRNKPYGGRILFAAGNDFLAVGGCYAGLKCFNGYFMVEDPDVFDLLYRSLPDAARFHRMNHLDADVVSGDAPVFSAATFANERIKLAFHAIRYDFSQLPVDYVAMEEKRETDAAQNASLRKSFSLDGILYYEVIR